MKTELVQTLTTTFEAHAQQTEGGIEYWLARDLQYLLGYDEWRNFTAVITKAKTACEVSGHAVSDHFVDVNKTIEMPKSAEKEIPDLMLTRYSCYLIAQNGDSRKQEIAFTQTYFAIQTRRAELIEQRLLEAERVSARRKLSSTEKELSQVIYEQTGGNEDFALIASEPVRSTNGAVSYQPGAMPQVFAHPIYQGPTARPIPATIRCGTKRLASGMGRAFSPRFVLPSIPGALPQAGIGSHLWCWGTPATRNLEQTIAGRLLSQRERIEVRVHRTAMNMAEILEA